MRTVFAMSAVLALAVSARGDVFSSEFRGLPTEEGWELVPPSFGVSSAIENGYYVQRLDPQARSTSPVRAQEIYARTPGDFYSTAGQFLEFRVQTNGRLSGSCYETPTQFIVSTTFGGVFRILVANDEVSFGDFSPALPLPFPLARGAAHTVRLELEWPVDAVRPIYRFFADDVLLWGGGAWTLLSQSTLLEWSGKSCLAPIENRWSYIRYGDIPADGSGDFDSDGLVDQRDYYFFHDCFVRRAPGQNDGPGCRFSDMDGDTAVDLRDFADFQLLFMDPG